MSRDHIPRELIIGILSRLPTKSLLRFRCVCKSWCALTHDPSFRELHVHNFNRHSNNAVAQWVGVHGPSFRPLIYRVFDETFSSQCPFKGHDIGSDWYKVVGSCKGLICLYHGCSVHPEKKWLYRVKMSLWNPSTRSHKKFEFLTYKFCEYPTGLMKGFGYSRKNKDHRFVIVLKDPEHNQDNVYVYSVTNNSWSEIQSKPSTPWIRASVNNTYLNGSYYWICQFDESKRSRIMCFDFDDNKFCNIDLPSDSKTSRFKTFVKKDMKLRSNTFVYKDMLAFWEVYFNENNNLDVEHTIWIMKDDGCSKSWTCLHKVGVNNYDKVPRFDARRVFGSTTDGRRLLYYGNDRVRVMAYDLETRQIEEIVQPSEELDLVAYEQSLF